MSYQLAMQEFPEKIKRFQHVGTGREEGKIGTVYISMLQFLYQKITFTKTIHLAHQRNCIIRNCKATITNFKKERYRSNIYFDFQARAAITSFFHDILHVMSNLKNTSGFIRYHDKNKWINRCYRCDRRLPLNTEENQENLDKLYSRLAQGNLSCHQIALQPSPTILQPIGDHIT